MSVRRARPDEWREVKELRLRALRDEPDAFHSRYEDEVDDPDEEWREWVERNPIFVSGRFEGIASAFLHENGSTQLIAMYVRRDARGRGHGRALVAAVEDWAREQGTTRLQLYVTPANVAARTLYERCGFADTGERRDDGSLLLVKTL